jgi:hypothetical protein
MGVKARVGGGGEIEEELLAWSESLRLRYEFVFAVILSLSMRDISERICP